MLKRRERNWWNLPENKLINLQLNSRISFWDQEKGPLQNVRSFFILEKNFHSISRTNISRRKEKKKSVMF